MNDFPKELDKWLDEEVDVPVMQAEVDDRGEFRGVKKGSVKRTVRTIYSKIDPQVMSCAVGKHAWYMKDKRRHIAGCGQCPKHRFLRAVYEKIVSGQILDRETGQVID